MKVFRLSVLMWQILFATFATYGQTILTGRIYEESEPALGAYVFLSRHREVHTITDEHGAFNIAIADSLSSDTLVVSYLGYKDYKMPLADWKDPCIISLTPDQNTTTLSEVVVKADATVSKEFAASQLDKLSIYMTPAAAADPLRVIALQAYSTLTEESAIPQLRGSTGNYSSVLINGVPIKNPVRNQQLNGIGNFSLFSADIVSQQFVYPSNPPLEYGNSIGGIVALNTTENLAVKHETNLSLSLANTGVFHSTLISEKSFMQAYCNRQISGPYKWMNASSLDYLGHFSSTDGGVNFRTTLSGKSYINAYAYVVKESYRSERGMYNSFGVQKAKNLRNFDILNYRLHSRSGVLGINAAWDMANRKYDYAAISDTTTQRSLYVSASYKHYLPKGVTLSAGVDYEHNSYHYQGIYPTLIYDLGNPTLSHLGRGYVHYNKYETYAYGKCLLGDFLLGASARGIFQVGAKPRWSYQASVKYNLSRQHALIASFGRYNALSLPSYFVRQLSNATSRQMSLDWKCKLTARCDFAAVVYWKKEHLPQYLVTDMEGQGVKNRILGVELCGKYTGSYFEWSGSYSFFNARMRYRNQTFPSDNSFRHMGKLMVSYLNPKILNVSVSCLYRGGLPYTPIVSRNGTPVYGELNSERYNNYFTLDLSINRFFRIGKIGLIPLTTITNITNRANQRYNYYNREYSERFVKLYNRRLIYIGCSIKL